MIIARQSFLLVHRSQNISTTLATGNIGDNRSTGKISDF